MLAHPRLIHLHHVGWLIWWGYVCHRQSWEYECCRRTRARTCRSCSGGGSWICWQRGEHSACGCQQCLVFFFLLELLHKFLVIWELFCLLAALVFKLQLYHRVILRKYLGKLSEVNRGIFVDRHGSASRRSWFELWWWLLWRVVVVFGATILDFIHCWADRWASLWPLTGQYPPIATQQDWQDFWMQDPWDFFLQDWLFTLIHLETWMKGVVPLGGNSSGLGASGNTYLL